MNSDNFLNIPPTRLFFRCAVPAVITSVFGALYSVVDGIFVGRFLGGDALAAINLIMPVIMIVESVSNMIATGASVNIAMLLGRKERRNASEIFSFSIVLIMGISVIISVPGFFFAESFIRILAPGAGDLAVRYSAAYLQIYALFGPLITVYFAVDNYLRVVSRERLSMIIGVASQVMNVILDYVLIVVLHKGVQAAAAASSISIISGSIIMLALFTGKRMDLYYTRPAVKMRQFARIVINGASELFSSISMSIMSIVMNLFLLKYGGTTAVAAFSIVMYVDSIIGMLNFGLCDSLQPAISYCYGAGQKERLKAIFQRVLIATITVSAVAFLFMFFAGPHVAQIFIKPGDEELRAVSIEAIRIFAFSYLAGWVDLCFSSLFTAMDKPAHSLVVSISGTLVFPLISICLLTSLWGLTGVWLSSTVSAVASSIVTLILVRALKPKRTLNE